MVVLARALQQLVVELGLGQAVVALHGRPTTENESYSTPPPLVCVAEPDAASVDGSVESGLGLGLEHERVPELVPVGEWPKPNDNDDTDGDTDVDDNDDERAKSAAEIVGQATRAASRAAAYTL